MSRRLFAFLLLSFIVTAPAFAGFDEGRAAYDRGRWVQAIFNLRPAAENGDARAMILLGNMYMEGHGVAQDTKEAWGLYHSAALKDNTDGMVAVATLYQTGNGVPTNTPLAVGWFERAARLGDMDAALIYAIHMYQGSHGKDYDIKPDHEASYRWFKIVAAHSKNPKQVKAAQFSADRIAKTLTHDELVSGDREVANWKPEMPAEIGPNPEEKFMAGLKDKGAAKPAPSSKGDAGKAMPDKTDADGGSATQAPEEKKATDAAPADKKSGSKKADDKKSDEGTASDDMPN